MVRRICKYKVILVLLLLILCCCEEVEKPKKVITKKDLAQLKEFEEIKLHESSNQRIGMILRVQIDESNSNIYLCDNSRLQVLVYNKLGRFLRTIGNPGYGKGEFQQIVDMRIHKNVVGVRDAILEKLSFFDTLGVFLGEINLSTKEYMGLPGSFDFSPDGKLIYLGIVEKKYASQHLLKKSKSVAVFNKDYEVVKFIGYHDLYVSKYFNSILTKQNILTTDKKGNIYTIQRAVPRVTKYDSNYNKIATFSFFTDNFKLQYSETGNKDQNDFGKSKVSSFYVGEKTGRMFIGHFYVEKSKGSIHSHRFLTVLNSGGEFVKEIKLEQTSGTLCLDQNEYVYMFKKYEPDNIVLGKYLINGF